MNIDASVLKPCTLTSALPALSAIPSFLICLDQPIGRPFTGWAPLRPGQTDSTASRQAPRTMGSSLPDTCAVLASLYPCETAAPPSLHSETLPSSRPGKPSAHHIFFNKQQPKHRVCRCHTYRSPAPIICLARRRQHPAANASLDP